MYVEAVESCSSSESRNIEVEAMVASTAFNEPIFVLSENERGAKRVRTER